MNFFSHIFTFIFMLFPIYRHFHPITALGSKKLGPCICRAAPQYTFYLQKHPGTSAHKIAVRGCKAKGNGIQCICPKGCFSYFICKEGKQVDAAGRSMGFLFGTSHKARILRAACFRFFSVKHGKGAQRLFFCARGKTAYGPVPF